MLEAKAWVYIEPVLPNEFVKRVQYITDLSSDSIFCSQDDIEKSLLEEFFCSRDLVSEMRDLFKGGRAVIINLIDNKIFKWDEDPITVKSGVVGKKPEDKIFNKFEKINKRVFDIVNKGIIK